MMTLQRSARRLGATFALASLAFAGVPDSAQAMNFASPVGTWKTIDDDSGQAKSIVKITERGGKLYGKITKLFKNPDAVCDECSGSKEGQPIVGMQIMWGLEQDDDEWSGGKILDPKNGKTYRCKIWMDGSNLKVRGYIGPFFRTQLWRPVG